TPAPRTPAGGASTATALRPSPFEADRVKKSSAFPEPRSSGANALAAEPAPMITGDTRQRLHAVLAERGLTFLADAVENSQVIESSTELKFVTSKLYAMYLKDPQLASLIPELFGRSLRVSVAIGEVALPTAPLAAAAPAGDPEGEVADRALSNPEVQ